MEHLIAAAGDAERLRGFAELTGASERDIRRAAEFVAARESENSFIELNFEVLGDPPTSKRPRHVHLRGKGGEIVGSRVYAADGADQRSVRREITRQLPERFAPFSGEVEIYFQIYRPMLASWPSYKRLLGEMGYLRPTTRPDWDNYAKLLTDAMQGVVFRDDGQVVVGSVSMYYSLRPRFEVTVCGRSA
jgi:Holliday junction resolvase RusA-like endonuclease